jgi:RNA recognition motif-containing protein
LSQKDKRTGCPKIWIYKDKGTNEPKGDATVTYEDPHAASAAVEWFNDKDFHGSIIQVHIVESKSKDTFDSSTHLNVATDIGGQDELDSGAGRGRGRGDGPGKAWQQDGDWMCPNTRSVMIGEQLYHFSLFIDYYGSL